MRPGVVPRLGPLAARRVLWLAALFLIPVPYWAIEVERAPVARLLLLAAVTGAAMLAEPGGVGSIVGGALVAQAILWLVVWAVVARLVERRLGAATRGTAVALIVATSARARPAADLPDAALEHGPASDLSASSGDRRPARRPRSPPRRPVERSEAREPCAGESSAAPAVLRRPPRAHALFARREHAGHPLAAERGLRFARGEPLGLQPFSARGAPGRTRAARAPARLRGGHRSRRAVRRGHACATRPAPGYDSTVCLIYRGWPRLAFFFMNGARARRRASRSAARAGSDCLAAAAARGGRCRRRPRPPTTAAPRAASRRSSATSGPRAWRRASNLHRNVIFRNAAVPELPASAVDALTPEDSGTRSTRECRAACRAATRS